MRKYLLFLLFFLFSLTSKSQHETISVSKICSFSYSESIEKACENFVDLEVDDLKSDTLEKAVIKVLNSVGLKQKDWLIKVLDNLFLTGVYCKPAKDRVARIILGKSYLNDYWVSVGILMHELGHLLNHHENLCTNPQLELDADLFAGRCLALLGATKDQASSCLNIEGIDVKNHLYPSKSERLNQFNIGYNSFFAANSALSFTSVNPRIRWEKTRTQNAVFIDEQKIILPASTGYSKNDSLAFDSNLGILYVIKTNSTYQLHGYSIAKKGIGELVNDKTPITYMRFGTNAFRIYNKAKIIPRKDVPDTITTGNGKDYEILYKLSPEAKEYTVVVLIDYFFTPNNILRPAFYK